MRYVGRFGIIAIVALLIAGCSGTNELRDGEGIAPYVRDVAKGGEVKWRLASDASPKAKRAWQNKGSIEAISYELRHGQAWWGCKLLDTLRRGLGEHQAALPAEQGGASVITVNEMIGKAHSLTPAELADIIGALCPAR